MFSQMSQDDTVRDMVRIESWKKCRLNTKNFIWNFYWAKIVPVLQKKCVWQVTTIIQAALRHLGTSHFWKVLYNKTSKGQIRWPIILFLMCMLVLTENMSIFPYYIILQILVFSCPKMTLISIFTRMTLLNSMIYDLNRSVDLREPFKHWQRHNGPEGWVHLSKVTYWVISQVQTSSSKSRPSIHFKIHTKHHHLD